MPLSPRRWFLYSIVALVFVGGVWYFGFGSKPPERRSSFGSFRRGSSQAVPVRAVPAQRQDMQVHLRAIGTVVPLNTVTVRSRVEGLLLKVTFQEGEHVKQGQVVAEIDPLPYQIQLSEAEAQLRQNEAMFQTAKADLDRLKPLQNQGLVTEQELQTQNALVAQREAAIGASRAQVADARRQLAYTKIEAPISGRAGLRQVDAGNLVRPGDQQGLVVITQTRPISVVFTIPEIDLQKVITPIRAGEELPVEAWDRGEQMMLASGMLRTVDNQIDLATGTLRLKAEFPNADDKLFPNQFVNVRLQVQTLKDAVVVPTAAVQFGSRGTYVYLVNEQSVATVRDIVLGPSDGERQSISKGLQAGDRVILEGLDRLREGRAVTLVTDEVPKPKGTPPPPPESGKKGEGKKGSKRSKT